MQNNRTTRGVAARTLLCTALLAAGGSVQAQIPVVGGWVNIHRDLLEPWSAKAACWKSLAEAEHRQGDSRGTAKTSAENSARILASLAAGREPTQADEMPIFSTKMLPSGDATTGRPAWRADIERADSVLSRYTVAQCRTVVSSCLDVAMQSVWENMEETQGARWNHGKPEIEKAVGLAVEADAAFSSSCDQPTEALIVIGDGPLQEHSISTDVLFAFDSAALTAEGRGRVGSLAGQIGALSAASHVRVRGYTDRFGTPAYNLLLSTRRAEAVAAALRDELRAHLVTAEGMGSAAPIVQCAGKQTQETVRCLAPNRRVVIEASR